MAELRSPQGQLARSSALQHSCAFGRAGTACLECLGQYKAEHVAVERDGLLDDPNYIRGLPEDHLLKRRENVFSFSNMAASLELMQMISMVIAPSGMGNPGAQIYHFVSGTLDKEEKFACNDGCFYRSIIAHGDHAGISAVGRHHVAEREGREHDKQMRAPRGRWRDWIKGVLTNIESAADPVWKRGNPWAPLRPQWRPRRLAVGWAVAVGTNFG